MSTAVAFAHVHLNTASLKYATAKGCACSSLKGVPLHCIIFRTATDPACGTAGFLVSASEYVRSHYESTMTDAQWNHFSSTMFSGFDTDPTMLRISAMNVLVSFQTVYCLVAIKPIKPSAKNW